MKAKLLLLSFVTALFVSCGTTRTVPLTGRQQTLMVSDEQVLSLSYQEYTKYMTTAKKSTNAANTAMVKRVGERLSTVVNNYFVTNGMPEEVKNYAWEFNLVSDNDVNAFCMPGGKIVVYEGLLPYTQDETSLAIVVGHEIAHAVARHSAEQMSKQIRNNMGVQVLGGTLGALGVGSTTTQIAQIVAQKGLEFRSLSYSREHELEADKMGLIFASMAGYDPRAAVNFWKRMAAGKQQQSDILSSHPSDDKRIAKIEQDMPIFIQYYEAAKKGTVSTTSAIKNNTSKIKSVSANSLIGTKK